MKNDPKFVRDSDSSVKLLTFQLSNVRELDTIKYAFVMYIFTMHFLTKDFLLQSFDYHRTGH